jgi:hypothetical protein
LWSWSRPSPELDADASRDKSDASKNELTDDELIARVATMAVSRRLTVPAILFLESSKPMAFIGSQFLVFMEPFVKTFISARSYDHFVRLMEDRANVERLIKEIERQEAESTRADGPGKQSKGGS